LSHQRKPEVGARLLARLDAGADQDLQRLRMFERVNRIVADPHETNNRVCYVVYND
jgi:hypothetical protein